MAQKQIGTVHFSSLRDIDVFASLIPFAGTVIGARFTDELQRILVSAELRPEVEKVIRRETVLS